MPGDLLLEKSGGGENQPVGCVVLYDHGEPAVCSNFVARVQLAHGMSSSYWRYVHASAYAVRLSVRSIKQTSGIQNLDSAQYFDERAPFPPIDEQVCIAAFLDRETAKIGALIAEQELLIELLQEKRQAVISHAVTKGLDPNVPMKPSGVEWLGDIPEHWAVIPIGRGCTVLSYGFTNPMPVSDSGPLLLTANDIQYGYVNYADARRTTWEAFERLLTDKSRPRSGDLLITKDGTLGRVAVHDGPDACINQSVAIARFDAAEFVPDFMCHCLLSDVYQERMLFDAGGTTIKHIYISRLAKMPVAVPPLDEQKRIVRAIDEQTVNLDMLVRDTEMAIGLLIERRSALISAAVTGQIDVRGLVGQEAA